MRMLAWLGDVTDKIYVDGGGTVRTWNRAGYG
jgi:hypothetical protein